MEPNSKLCFPKSLSKFIQNLEIGMSKTSYKAKKRTKARDNTKSKK